MKEMEEEASRLKAFQAEADDSLNLSGSALPAATSPAEKKEIDARSIYVGNVSFSLAVHSWYLIFSFLQNFFRFEQIRQIAGGDWYNNKQKNLLIVMESSNILNILFYDGLEKSTFS